MTNTDEIRGIPGSGFYRNNPIELSILGTAIKVLLDMAVRLFLQALDSHAVVHLLPCPTARESSA